MSVTTSAGAAGVHGPASLVGVAAGLVLAATPVVLGLEAGWWVVLLLVGPVVGLVLLLVPGTARQVGIGLVASALTYPAALLAVVVIAVAG